MANFYRNANKVVRCETDGKYFTVANKSLDGNFYYTAKLAKRAAREFATPRLESGDTLEIIECN